MILAPVEAERNIRNAAGSEMKKIKKKIWPEYFEAVKSGKKTYELRLNDFKVNEGDTLVLEEWDPKKKEYTGRSLEKKVLSVNKFKIDVLSPFPGRVDNAEYSFQNKKYKISGLSKPGENPCHAFVKYLDWQLTIIRDNHIRTSLVFSGNSKPDWGYPFYLNYVIDYELIESGLRVEFEVKNTGKSTAPLGIGFHPYFMIGKKIDDLFLKIPAKKMVDFDSSLKPTGELIPIEKSALDFSRRKKIGTQLIDNCFTQLIYKNGCATTEISDSELKITIWQDKNLPYIQIYSADNMKKTAYRRRAIAIEPQSCCGYAVNVPKMGLISLGSGEIFSASWGVNFESNVISGKK